MTIAADLRIIDLVVPEVPYARISGSVTASIRFASDITLGATQNQLITKPNSVAGNSHSAGSPQANAAPLTPKSVHADDELAEALIAATSGPRFLPPMKKSAAVLVRLDARIR